MERIIESIMISIVTYCSEKNSQYFEVRQEFIKMCRFIKQIDEVSNIKSVKPVMIRQIIVMRSDREQKCEQDVNINS
jgi:hypothetical protein